MACGVIAEGHDSDVGFRLRVVEQRQRALGADDGPARERDRQDFRKALDRVRVSGILRRHRHQHTFEQFESFALERAALDEAIVFGAQKGPDSFRRDVGDIGHGTSMFQRNHRLNLKS